MNLRIISQEVDQKCKQDRKGKKVEGLVQETQQLSHGNSREREREVKTERWTERCRAGRKDRHKKTETERQRKRKRNYPKKNSRKFLRIER